MIKISLLGYPDCEFETGTPIKDVITRIAPQLKKSALIAEVNNQLKDLDFQVQEDSNIKILTFKDESGLRAYRHTASHILAHAVKNLYPDAKLAIGPATENGFYYDFDVEHPFSEEDLIHIEKEMSNIIRQNLQLSRFILERDKAIKFMSDKLEHYKVELIKDLPSEEEISFYKQGDFVDLCSGPHLTHTGKIKAFKLLSVAGAYWRGSEKNKMLQRIYGTCFDNKNSLDEYLKRLEEAKKRDHRKLGRELALFEMSNEGPGFPFFLPKGMILRNILESFWRTEHAKNGYKEIRTPLILNQDLWHKSGHWEHYKENMYFTKIDENEYAIKPMNCPGAMLTYKKTLHSYRELPERLAELGIVHRHEISGVLHGLMRVRCFTQDDAHIFMTLEQVRDEVVKVIQLIDNFYSVFGFKYNVELSTKPKKRMGSDEQWDIATDALKDALLHKNIAFKINEGDGAFYGPKIDFHLEDSIGRTWQCGTIQLDFQMPERFNLIYIGEDGEKHRPVIIHRVVFGSIERFIGILIEHFAGAFPLWLAPVQVKIVPILGKHIEYAHKLQNLLEQKEIRYETDARNEKIGYKIREARLQRIPFIVVIGDKEMENSTVSVTSRQYGDMGSMSLEQFSESLLQQVRSKQ